MRCGISTACFYPDNTLLSLQTLADAGVEVTELFLNTFSELEDDFVAKLLDVQKQSGIDIVSVHPFTSQIEGFLFATEYAGRFEDGVRIYERYFKLCRALGAGKLVFHGDHKWAETRFPLEEYAKRFVALSAVARRYGVALCHENVSYCRLGDPGTVRKARPLFGPAAAFVLDTKQVLRYGADVEDMLAAMGEDIRHVHISDFLSGQDCIPPGRGRFDFEGLLHTLSANGYRGDLIIELYRDGFKTLDDLLQAKRYIEALLARTQP